MGYVDNEPNIQVATLFITVHTIRSYTENWKILCQLQGTNCICDSIAKSTQG